MVSRSRPPPPLLSSEFFHVFRGNHEVATQNCRDGFQDEARRRMKRGIEVWRASNLVYSEYIIYSS